MNRTNRIARLSIVLLAFLAFAGCADATSSDVPADATITKAAALQLAEEGDYEQEWCARMSWYGDDVCDSFCRNPDPDCFAADLDSPWLLVDEQLDGVVIEDDRLRISGSASDESGIQEVMINGHTATLKTTTVPTTDVAWTYELELPESGAFRVIVIATDGAGNASSPQKLIVEREEEERIGAWH